MEKALSATPLWLSSNLQTSCHDRNLQLEDLVGCDVRVAPLHSVGHEHLTRSDGAAPVAVSRQVLDLDPHDFQLLYQQGPKPRPVGDPYELPEVFEKLLGDIVYNSCCC